VLKYGLKGAESLGFETEVIHLYKLHFKGCKSCFACKVTGGKSHGKCALSDELTPVLERLKDGDAIIFGTPVYLFNISSGMSAFLERFLYPYIMYSKEKYTQYPKKIPHAFIYTMNDTIEMMKGHGTDTFLAGTQKHPAMVFQTTTDVLYVNNTYQFPDYSKYESSVFDEKEKLAYHQNIFPMNWLYGFLMLLLFAAHSQK